VKFEPGLSTILVQDLAINAVFSADAPFPLGRADVFSDLLAAFDDDAPNRVAHAVQLKKPDTLTGRVVGLIKVD